MEVELVSDVNVDVDVDDVVVPIDHCQLTEVKHEDVSPAECREDYQTDGFLFDDEGYYIIEDHDRSKKSSDYVCNKCYKPFHKMRYFKRHIECCIFNSDMLLRRAEMLDNIEQIEKEAISMEENELCFCCGDSYDNCHLGHINCTECPKAFRTQTSLERHMFLIHSENDDFPCHICNGRIRSKSILKLHLRQHENCIKPFFCKVCGKDFTRKFHLKRHHMNSVCGEGELVRIICKFCGREFRRLDNLRAHLSTHIAQDKPKYSEYTCAYCNKFCRSLSELSIHVRTHTGERPFDCDLCDKNFSTVVALRKHRRSHTGEKLYPCALCQQNFGSNDVLIRHMKSHTGERKHVCNQCGKRFIQSTHLKVHLRTHLRPYECALCSESFKTQKQFETHYKLHTSGENPLDEFNCKICKLKFSSRGAIEQHKKTAKHIKNATQISSEDGEKCSSTSSIQSEVSDGRCDQCGMDFKDFDLLLHHKKSLHNTLQQEYRSDSSNDGEKILNKFKCTDCNLQFNTLGGIGQHEKTKKHIRNATKASLENDEQFSNKSSLKCDIFEIYYKSEITNGDESILKKFSCNDCKLQFYTTAGLLQHKKTKKHLKGNAVRKISDMQRDITNSAHKTFKKSAKSELKNIDDSIKKFNCNDCNLQFSSQSGLVQHKKSKKHSRNVAQNERKVNEQFPNTSSLESHNEYESSDVNSDLNETLDKITTSSVYKIDVEDIKQEEKDDCVKTGEYISVRKIEVEKCPRENSSDTDISNLSPESTFKNVLLSRAELRKTPVNCLREVSKKVGDEDMQIT